MSEAPTNLSSNQRCGWFGEGRGQCLLQEGHEKHYQTRHHTCEEDGRIVANRRAVDVPLRAALAELVRLKDLHDVCEDQTYWATRAVSEETIAQLRAWEADYAQNKPLAWSAARAALSGDSPSAPETRPKDLQSQDERTLRLLLAMAYSGIANLYTDDGELQDGSEVPVIDYKRDPVEDIRRKIHQRGAAKVASTLKATAPRTCDWPDNHVQPCDCSVNGPAESGKP